MTRRGSRRKKSNNAIVPVSGHSSTQCDGIDRSHDDSNRGFRPNFGRHPDHADFYRVTHIKTDESTKKSFKLFDKAKSMIATIYPGKKIMTFFEDINLEIMHLIPIFDPSAPDLIVIETVEENSLLLGCVGWYSLTERVIYVKDVVGGGIHFKLDQTTPLSKLKIGQFVAIISPKLTILPNGRFGFRTDENVHIIDRSSLESRISFWLLCGMIAVAGIVWFFYFR